MKTFWMVLGSGTPTYRHSTELSARNEAARLAAAHNGREFTVLKSIATAKKTDIQWSLHRADEPGCCGVNDGPVPF